MLNVAELPLLSCGEEADYKGNALAFLKLLSGFSLCPVNFEVLRKAIPQEGLSPSPCFCAVPPTINRGDVPGMDLSPKEMKIKINHSLTLECEAHAVPAAAISWYKDGQASHNLISFQWVAFLQKKLQFSYHC